MSSPQTKDTSTVSSAVAKWVKCIDTYESKFSSWQKRSKKIIERYRDERKDEAKKASRFNILWSNIQTLHPAIYASPPTPNIDRRFQDDDDLGRYSALVLERAVTYYVKDDTFNDVMSQVTLDRLLPGRGTAWVRYCPVFGEEPTLTDDATDKPSEEGEQVPDLLSEDVVVDYVHWCDFGHTWARTWQEVEAVWRIVYLSRKQLVKRFGEEVGNKIPLDAKPEGSNEDNTTAGIKATVYEIWDKTTKKVTWLNKGMPDILDEQDDPLGLKDFFPCPKPIYATLSNEDLIPSPDYTQYQDQAIELDTITARIAAITKAIKVAGVYDASAEGIDRLLSEGVENKLIPVQQFAILGGGKGLDGVVSLFPLEQIVVTLKSLYESRERVKQDLYEITGISDIVRGATKANETATAQQLKGQYASLRLDYQQKDAARFARDLVRMEVQIIANHFDVETIKAVSGVKLLTEQEKQQIQMQQQMEMQQAQQQSAMAQQQGQDPQPTPEPKPLPEEIQELMEMPSWEKVIEVIRNDTARSFRIDIETDSTIKTDQEAEKQARVEFLGAVSGFMAQAAATPPELRNLAMEMLMFGVRGFKVSRELETSFEATMDKIRKEEENPQPKPPSPEEIKAQAEQQRTQAEMQIQQMKSQSDMQMLQAKMQSDQMKAQADMQLKQADIELKRMDLQLKEYELQIKAKDVEARAFETMQPKETAPSAV